MNAFVSAPSEKSSSANQEGDGYVSSVLRYGRVGSRHGRNDRPHWRSDRESSSAQELQIITANYNS
jgi:hypothetical protein